MWEAVVCRAHVLTDGPPHDSPFSDPRKEPPRYKAARGRGWNPGPEEARPRRWTALGHLKDNNETPWMQ